MYAGLVLRQLVCCNLVLLHVLRVCMTTPAGLSHSRRMRWGARIFYGPYIMVSVATDAGCPLLVSLSQSLAMDAGSVLGFLIHMESWIESLHERGIAVTLAAKRGHCSGLWFSNVACSTVHCPLLVGFGGIASMTVRTRDPSIAMHVVFRFVHGSGKLRF